MKKALLVVDMQNVCVALTALGAIKNGYKVIVNEAAIGTMFDKNRDKYFKKLRDAGAEFI